MFAIDIFAAYNLERGLTNIAIAGQNGGIDDIS